MDPDAPVAVVFDTVNRYRGRVRYWKDETTIGQDPTAKLNLLIAERELYQVLMLARKRGIAWLGLKRKPVDPDRR